MKLTATLLSRLTSIFKIEPKPLLVLRLRNSNSAMRWTISDGLLTTANVDYNLSVDLSAHTIGSLINYLDAQGYRSGRDYAAYSVDEIQSFFADYRPDAGYSVLYPSPLPVHAWATPYPYALSALALMDGTGNQNEGNGDHLYINTGWCYALFESFAHELTLARQQIANMLLQFSTATATGEWLDELGSFYNVGRNIGEPDSLYGNRIIAQTIMPQCNNVALEISLEKIFGVPALVTDASISAGNICDGTFVADGSINANGASYTVSGSFHVNIPDNSAMLGLSTDQYYRMVAQHVLASRAAGTQPVYIGP